MMIPELLGRKDLKPKQKTESLSKWIADGVVSVNQLIQFANCAKPPILATCIESLEFVTQNKPELLTREGMQFVLTHVNNKAPRVKWECGKVIGNCIHLFSDLAEEALKALLINSEDEGTVVRWSAAFAIGKIYRLQLPLNAELLPAISAIINREEKNSIKKIYHTAVKTEKSKK